ncbi:MAG TPA: D-alanyl-D-alanine carboxypeptidase/D-alanyl-D-alanine-endopeptidase [Longimicrobiaceae bacterium]|nr:D-alanyl-D-alanine carboxypeptidase/D-alanyl-D-alanine-endopeptidase [Longimicrobiaceae bacterium]
MDSRSYLRASGLAVFFSLLATVAPAQRPPLQGQAEAITSKVGGRWGVLAWVVGQKDPLVAINADSVFTPASNNKVFTSIWALSVLGQDYRFPTDLLITGPIRGGVLEGDVVLRGSGDPAFGYPEFTGDDPMRPLRIMARRLKELGVRQVRGSVVGDPFIFDTIHVGPDWPRDTGGGAAAYAPGVSGLPFQRNLIAVEATPGPNGRPVIELEPPVEVVPIENRMHNGGGRGWAVRAPDSDTIEVRGSVAGRAPHIYRIGVRRPALMTTDALRAAMEQEGIQIRGGVRLGHTPDDATLVHRHFSIPLKDMVHEMNHVSDNFFAEHLWKAAVAKTLGEGSYARGGPASAIFYRRHARVPFGQLYQFDGSGLSDYDRITPNAMVRALIYANSAPFSQAFHASLPVGGQRGGTLDHMFRSGAAEGNLHAKTGYINDVRTLSGYVTAKNGQLIAFSFLYNGRGTWPARTAEEQLGQMLADYDGAP